MKPTVPTRGKKILITGVSCVGKSTIGRRLAEILDCAFYDLDLELERHFRMPISRLKALSLTGYSFRQKASRVLGWILHENRYISRSGGFDGWGPSPLRSPAAADLFP